MPLLFDALFSSVALSHFMVDTLNASRPVLLTYLGLRETEIALLSSIYIWVSALTQPFFGWLSDRAGPRWLASGGILWMAGFYSAALLLPGAAGLVCLVLAALGSSAFHPVGTVQATLRGRERLHGRETTAASIFFMAGQSGHFVGPIVTGLILSAKGLPVLLLLPIFAVPVGFFLGRQLHANHPHPREAERHGSPRKRPVLSFVLALAGVAATQSWAQANMVNLMPKYLKDMGHGAAVYGVFAGLFMGGSAIGNLIGGMYGDRFPKRLVSAASLGAASVPILLISQIGWSSWLYVLVPLAGALTGAVHSNMVVLAQRLIPGGMALSSGLALGFIFSAGAFGLLLTGPMAEAQGFPAVLLLTAMLLVLAAPASLLLHEPSRGMATVQIQDVEIT